MAGERRKYTRLPKQALIKVDILCSEQLDTPLVFECRSKDFSVKGIRIHGQHPVPLNNDVKLVVHLGNEAQKLTLFGTIKWITETTENEHLAGIELSDNQVTDIASWQLLFQNE